MKQWYQQPGTTNLRECPLILHIQASARESNGHRKSVWRLLYRGLHTSKHIYKHLHMFLQNAPYRAKCVFLQTDFNSAQLKAGHACRLLVNTLNSRLPMKEVPLDLADWQLSGWEQAFL